MKTAIIILCHGSWGESLVQDVRKNFGFKNEMEVVPLTNDISKETYLENIEKVHQKYKRSVFVCDLFGSTTFKSALILALKNDELAFCDLSMEILIKLSNCIEEQLTDEQIKQVMNISDCSKGEELVEKYRQEFGGKYE